MDRREEEVLPHQTNPTQEEGPSSASLLDMDICGLSELTSTLTPIIVHSNKNGKDDSEPHGNLHVKKSDSEFQGQIKNS